MHKGTSVLRDLVLIAAATIVVALASVHLEVSEAIQTWGQRWERYQLDEVPGILLFAATAMAWFAWRRMKEARAELVRRVKLEGELAAALSENRRLVHAQVQVQEAERRSLARELHDEFGQHLNAIKIDAVTIRSSAEGDIHRAAVSIIGIADHMHAIVRDMTRRLRPAGLDELGLPAALEHYAEALRARLPDLDLDLEMSGDLENLGESLNMALYRVIQEGLTNVSRHANARQVQIRLQRGASAGAADAVLLTLSDDGQGSIRPRNDEGVGLIGMRERVEALGGRLEVASAATRGFRVSAWVPVAEAVA